MVKFKVLGYSSNEKRDLFCGSYDEALAFLKDNSFLSICSGDSFLPRVYKHDETVVLGMELAGICYPSICKICQSPICPYNNEKTNRQKML